jgi:transposase
MTIIAVADKTLSKSFNDIDSDELDALIKRVSEAQKHELALSPQDCQLLLDALLTLASMQENLASKDVTINKLRKLAGMIQSSESLGAQVRSGKGKQQNRRNKPKPPPLKPAVIPHKLDHLCKGDECPECQKGKLYKYEPAMFLRITGQSPFVPEQHVMERLRCNTCGAYFTASMPEEVLADGDKDQKYGFTARSIMGVAKFYAGSPYYRQSSLQDLLGVPIAASTLFDQTEYLSNALFPVFRYLRHILAADAAHFYVDDTTNRIIDQQPILKKQRNSNKERIRTGVYTSGLIATTELGKRIVLFETNIGHAGEFIDDILKNRTPSNSPPIMMSDALSHNRPTVTAVISALCNSHGRRQFYDVHSHFPDEVEHVIERYGLIWQYETETVDNKLSPGERLAHHKKYALPVMEEIRLWGNTHLKNDTVEENSGLGKAIRYFDKHFDGLTRFCQIQGAMVDNNLMEAMLKLIARNRKNASFFKTGSGAAIGDVITSLIATAMEAGVNPVDYFNVLQRNGDDVKAHPEKYLPWNYQATA